MHPSTVIVTTGVEGLLHHRLGGERNRVVGGHHGGGGGAAHEGGGAGGGPATLVATELRSPVLEPNLKTKHIELNFIHLFIFNSFRKYIPVCRSETQGEQQEQSEKWNYKPNLV